MRNIIIILIILAMIPIVMALEDCKGIMLPSPADIPCLVISPFQYENSCDTYTVNVYYSNQTPNLLSTMTMASYGPTGRCNITFNYTTRGSYLLNFSSGDSAKIIVEGEDDMASLSVTLFVVGITFVVIFIGLKATLSKNQVANLIIKRCLILLGLFLLSLNTTIILTMADNAGLGINRELFRYLWMINWSIYLFMVWLMWTTIVNVLKLWEKLTREKRMGAGGDDEYT